MALSDDQRAMLQLLLEGGQNYADIAALLGTEEAEVRSRARASLRELGGADPDSDVGLTDYLLGQADPIGRADAARHLQRDEGAAALAAKLAAQLRVIAPQARLPDLPGTDAGGSPTGATAPAASAPVGAGAAARVGDTLRSLGSRERRLPLAIGLGALVVLGVVLAITGVIGGGDDGETTTEAAGDPREDLTIVELEPQNDSGASGQVTFARVQDQPVLQINLSGLPSTGQDQNYIVWLFNSDELAIPVGFFPVGKDGNFTGPAPIPREVIPYLPQIQMVDVSLARTSDVEKEIKAAQKRGQISTYVGESVLRGTIPRDPTDATGGLGETGDTGTAPIPTTPAPQQP